MSFQTGPREVRTPFQIDGKDNQALRGNDTVATGGRHATLRGFAGLAQVAGKAACLIEDCAFAVEVELPSGIRWYGTFEPSVGALACSPCLNPGFEAQIAAGEALTGSIEELTASTAAELAV